MNEPLLLVIDDDPVARETIRVLLTHSEYRLEFAASGAEGIEKAARIHPEVILLDVMMPGMDGFTVCRSLRADPFLSEVPIIMITALDDRGSRLSGLEVGADDFLTKPFDILELEIRLRSLQRVARYRHLVEEREKLFKASQQMEVQNEALKRLSEQCLNSQESEQRRLAMELHDEIGQTLTGLKRILESLAGAEPSEREETAARALEITNELLKKVRELSLDLRPAVLDDFGLLTALTWLFQRVAQQAGLHVDHNIDPLDERRFPAAIETACFRITQEALTNIIRHAGVKQAAVRLKIDPERLSLSIRDSGSGFDTGQPAGGSSLGISGMRERTRLAGGKFSLESTPGTGTVIHAEFPLQAGG